MLERTRMRWRCSAKAARGSAAALVACTLLNCGETPGPCEGIPQAETIAGQVPVPTDFLLDSDGVAYFLDTSNGRIHRIVSGREVDVVVENEPLPRNLASDETSLYWVTNDLSIRAADKASWSPRTVYSGGGCQVEGGCSSVLVAGIAGLYFWESGSGRILKVDKMGTSAVELGHTEWSGLSVAGDYLYWTNVVVPDPFLPVSLEVVRTLAGGKGVPETVTELGDRWPVRVLATESHVLVGTRDRTTGTRALLAVEQPNGVREWVTDNSFAFAVDGDSLFFSEAELIIAASLVDDSTRTVACASEAEPVQMAASPSNLYWVAGASIFALPR